MILWGLFTTMLLVVTRCIFFSSLGFFLLLSSQSNAIVLCQIVGYRLQLEGVYWMAEAFFAFNTIICISSSTIHCQPLHLCRSNRMQSSEAREEEEESRGTDGVAGTCTAGTFLSHSCLSLHFLCQCYCYHWMEMKVEISSLKESVVEWCGMAMLSNLPRCESSSS